jgi:multicomponent Na+:H+ antiporter subunit G
MNVLTHDIVTAILVLAGAAMCLAAGVGLIRFPDVLSRLHAATKPQIFGLMAVTADVAINNFSVGTDGRASRGPRRLRHRAPAP